MCRRAKPAWHTDPTYPPTASGYWLPRCKSTAGCPAAWYLSTAVLGKRLVRPRERVLRQPGHPTASGSTPRPMLEPMALTSGGRPSPTGSRSSLRLGPRKTRTLPWRPMATRSSRRSATTHARSGFMTRMETGKFPPKATPPVTAYRRTAAVCFIWRRKTVRTKITAANFCVSDLHSAQVAKVLPGIRVASFSLSPDGKRVAYDARDENGKHRIWLASLDHRFAPRQVSSGAGESSPQYVPSGKIYFRVSEGEVDYLYRMNDDGTQREKILPEPIIYLDAVSPDERFVAIRRATKGEDNPTAVDVVPLAGGRTVRVCSGWCNVSWTRDEKYFYLSWPPMKGGAQWRTFIIPLAHGSELPPLPANGIQSEKDIPEPLPHTGPVSWIFVINATQKLPMTSRPDSTQEAATCVGEPQSNRKPPSNWRLSWPH